MQLEQRLNILKQLGNYLMNNRNDMEEVIQKAFQQNGWFIPAFTYTALDNIVHEYLSFENLQNLIKKYQIPDENTYVKRVGIVMAGNIPLVGFHDLLCVFISGHKAVIKPSSKDDVLIEYIVNKMISFDADVKNYIDFSERLKNCDAYIATGSNNSSRYFEYYFSRYPHIIRKSRSSAAILDGSESNADLEKLADDIMMYFGLGCRSITKLYIPLNYDFIPLLKALEKYSFAADNNKYKNNFDYQLALKILNKEFYMTNNVVILSENASIFSAVSVVHYEFYESKKDILENIKRNDSVQCIVSNDFIPFGAGQTPGLCDYADKVDTMSFLMDL